MGKSAANGEGSLFYDKKRKRWIGRISAPGTYGKKRRSVSAKTKAQCREKMRKLQAELEGGTTLDAEKLTFGEYLDRWLRDSARDSVKSSTLIRYEGIVRNHLKPALGHVKLTDVGPASLQALYSEKIKEGLAPGTVRRIHAVAGIALKQAKRWRLIPNNPAEDATAPRNRPLREPKALSQDDALRLLEAVREWRTDRYALFLLAITTGMRQGEMLGLHWRDVNLESGEVWIRWTLDTSTGKPEYRTPKGGKSRRIKLTKAAVEALKAHKKLQNEERLRDPEWEDGNLVFTGPSGKEIFRANLMESFKRLLRRKEFPKMTFHELRHTCASLLLEGGVDMKTTQALLGHADVRVTLNTYSHVSERLEQAAADRMDALLE